MDDKKIIELFLARDENAIRAVEKKYGNLCYFVASNILARHEDREECVNDVLLALWNAIPPEIPENLRAYIAKAARNRALAILRDSKARCRGEVVLVGDDNLALIEDGSDLLTEFESKRMSKVVSDFLRTVDEEQREIFVLRYFLGMKLDEVAKRTGSSLGRVKMSLSRTKKKLEEELRKEGFAL